MTKTNNLPGCKKYDIAIIGAGPAGIMAAISASIFLKSQVKNSFDKKDAAKITRQEQDFISANSFTDKNSENANSSSIINNSGTNNGSSSSSSICIIERNESAAKKLLLTGNGRCNYTAAVDKDDLVLAFGKKGRFFSDAFNELSNRDLIDFFKKEGIEPEYEKPDENGNLVKVFPKNKNASSILQCLTCILQENNIHVFYGFRVEKILKVKNPGETGEKSLFEILPFNGCRFANPSNNNPGPDDKKIGSPSYGTSAAGNYLLSKKPFGLFAEKIILATGGKTYPQTGSTGDGYKIAKKMGHTINELIPRLIPIFIKDRDIAMLAGVSLKEAGLKILSGEKVVAKSTGSLLFTHNGLSGPCAVSIGHEVYKLLSDKQKKGLAANGSNLFENNDPNSYKMLNVEVQDLKQDFIRVSIDLAPDLSFESFKKEIFKICKSNPKKELLTLLNMIFKSIPDRLLDLILTRCKITKNLKISNLSRVGMLSIYGTIKNLECKIDSKLHFDEAIVTEGGIPLKEINPKNMQSGLIEGLYFAGEIIELAGPEGGFNLQKAFSTGWLAGKSAAKGLSSKEQI